MIVVQEAEVSDVPPQKIRARRGAVSASVMTEEQATSYVKKARVYTDHKVPNYVHFVLLKGLKCSSTCVLHGG